MITSHFRKELLPHPAQFWRSELAPRRLSRPSRGWARTTCPLHHGDNPTAFSANVNTGAFYCHACGAKGGDIVSFVMQRDHLDFKAAAQLLGAWDERKPDPARIAEIEQAKRVRDRKRAEQLAQQQTVTTARRECADEIRWCERVLADAGKRLDEVREGPEAEKQWEIMALATDFLPQLEDHWAHLCRKEDEVSL